MSTIIKWNIKIYFVLNVSIVKAYLTDVFFKYAKYLQLI